VHLDWPDLCDVITYGVDEATMKRVTIYTTDYCGFCTRAKQFLQRRGVQFEEVDVSGDDGKRAELVERTGRRTVPQIFIGEEPVGGYSDLIQLDAQGELDIKLAS
jgi:glutaredoxin 3